ncbi:MAG: hypothetical protein MJZ57_04180 [Bacteroidales bacterium]|nr:hypothetical protein [Bacteroidales bacterium]
MKKTLLALALFMACLTGSAQTQHMKFLGIDLNCTISTFTSKLKGKGFVQDMNNSHDNLVVAKGVFAGERVKLEVKCATKTHLVHTVNVCFNLSSSYTFESLKTRLIDKYGAEFKEFKNVAEGEGFVKYATDYIVWELNPDEEFGEANKIVLTKCNYRSTSPLVISYIDNKNSKIDIQEINSDF